MSPGETTIGSCTLQSNSKSLGGLTQNDKESTTKSIFVNLRNLLISSGVSIKEPQCG